MKTNKHPKLANGQPAISCLNMSAQELYRRHSAAHVRAEQQSKGLSGKLTENDLVQEVYSIVRGIMWHTDFADGLRLQVCDNSLFRLAADLPSRLTEANGGEPLDFWDYGYVADLLRELLSREGETKGDRLCMKRALAWAEDRGSELRDYGRE